MKKQYAIFILAIMLFSGGLMAQLADDWKPVLLGVDGTNTMSGVDAFYMLEACNSNETIQLKLINHNNYAVKACWKNLVVNKYDQRLSSSTVQDSVTIQPNSTIIGNCAGNKNIQLVIKLADFGILKDDFSDFITSNFDYVIIH